jgi:hypothetical protein
MGCFDTLLTWCMYLAVACGAYYTMFCQVWVGVCLTVPPLLGDVIVRRTHKQAAFVVKLLLLFQTIMLWTILPWATFHSFDTAEMSPRVVNIIQPIQDKIPTRAALEDKIRNWIPKIGMSDSFFSSARTEIIVEDVFGNLSTTNFPDLKFRSSQEVRGKLRLAFEEMPSDGFDPSFLNPCWFHDRSPNYDTHSGEGGGRRGLPGRPPVPRPGAGGAGGAAALRGQGQGQGDRPLSCLPFVYLLGMPKSGTSDLYERLISHPDIIAPKKKEIRWFTRGEFTVDKMPPSQMLGERTSLYSFTSYFDAAAAEILSRRSSGQSQQAITIDGGPHTLWWPTQSPDGDLLPEEVPPAQILREMQPHAKFLITLSDPVQRMYSDYYFLDDSLKPVDMMNRQRRGHDKADATAVHQKSPQEFHTRAVAQVSQFQQCVRDVELENKEVGWFRASQICAHDRKKFGVGGWGRLNIGIYVAFLEKWLEHFSLSQFHVVRLEDYKADPAAYMRGVLDFLGIASSIDMSGILTDKVFNQHKTERPDMLPATDKLLRDFYQPYNDLLAKLLRSDRFQWLGDYHPDTQPDAQAAASQATAEKEKQKQKHPRIGEQFGPNAHKVVQPGARAPHAQPSAPTVYSHKPKEFSLEGLDMPAPGATLNAMSMRHVDPRRKPAYGSEAGEQLCIAVFAMDLLAVKILLVDHKVDANTVIQNEFNRNAFHCLSVLNLNVDGHTKSHIFHLLKGDEGYLTHILDPPLPLHIDSTIGSDVIKSLEPTALKIAKWLLRAGADLNLADRNGVTPLHFACVAGNIAYVKFLLDNGANPNSRTVLDERIPSVFAAAYGHAEIVKLLIDNGADLDATDYTGTSTRDIIKSPGPLLAEDVRNILKMEQDAVRTVPRPMYPSYNKSIDTVNDKGAIKRENFGMFDPTRLKGFEEAMHCDADQYEADEITGEEIYRKYLARNRPVLIKGLIDKWPAVNAYRRDILKKDHGDLRVDVTSIPYAEKFGGDHTVGMPLGEYMDQVLNHSVVGGTHPWYVFIGHPLKKKERISKPRPQGLRGGPELDTDAQFPMGRAGGARDMVHTHLVDFDTVPTPPSIHAAMQLMTRGPTASAKAGPPIEDRK